MRSGGNVVQHPEVPPPSTLNNTNTPTSQSSTDGKTGMVIRNISELEAGTTYTIQIAAIREGDNGEGEQGPALLFSTDRRGHI